MLPNDFLAQWKSISTESTLTVNRVIAETSGIQKRFESVNLVLIASREIKATGQHALYFVGRVRQQSALIQIITSPQGAQTDIIVKSTDGPTAIVALHAAQTLLTA